MSQPVVMAPAEKLVGLVSVAFVGAAAAYVILRNLIAKRYWVARWVVRFALGFAVALLSMRLIVFMGFHGWWIQYIGYAVGFTVAYRLVAPLTVQDWNRLRPRRPPKPLQRKVIERHIRLTGSYDPSREHIDHVYPFAKGGGHTLDNLHIIPKEQNQRKRDQDPSAMDWARADFARARAFIIVTIRRYRRKS